MYQDEIWYRKFETAVSEHRDDFDEKKWQKYHIDSLLHIGKRIKDASDGCDICRTYQQTLTRLEEEILELPGSKAQRQYQMQQFAEIGQHFYEKHDLVPKGYHLRLWLRRGLTIGGFAGLIVVLFVTGNPVHFLFAVALFTGTATAYGYSEDERVKRENRIL